MLVVYCPDLKNCLPSKSQALDVVVGTVDCRVQELAHGVPLCHLTTIDGLLPAKLQLYMTDLLMGRFDRWYDSYCHLDCSPYTVCKHTDHEG